MFFVTRREVFSAAHRLYNPKFSDEENERIFGKCSNPNWHGHNYTLEVVVTGEVNPDTGYVVDLKVLKEIIIKNVIQKVDHKNLNTETDFMTGIIPTAENVAAAIWKQLVDKIPGGRLYAVKLYETENNYFEYRGE
ncbi:MAG: 6-carboxytetrahydropterin synthase [Ignavibacteriaceae bacterium]|nr:6-carboxytetrahydropterin synthase [Ignavibacteriaceae bacterium]